MAERIIDGIVRWLTRSREASVHGYALRLPGVLVVQLALFVTPLFTVSPWSAGVPFGCYYGLFLSVTCDRWHVHLLPKLRWSDDKQLSIRYTNLGMGFTFAMAATVMMVFTALALMIIVIIACGLYIIAGIVVLIVVVIGSVFCG